MPDENQKVSYRGKYLRQMDGNEKSSYTFWLIMLCVAVVMAILVFLFIPRHGSGIPPEPAPLPSSETSGPTGLPTTPDQTGKSKGQMGPEIPVEELKKLFTKAESALRKKDFVLARDSARKIISAKNSERGAYYDKAVAILNTSSSELLSSDAPAPEKKRYTIQKGDTLAGIANKFNTTIEAVQVANKLDLASSVIFPGKILGIYEGKWGITVAKGKFKLYLYDGDNIFKIYDIGIGKQNRTPAGLFEVKIKEKEPNWYSDGKTIPYGEKENILGTRWMSLSPVEGAGQAVKGLGIHGTWENGSIRTETSNGCIRMLNSEVEELFRIIPYNTKIEIED